MRCAAILPFHWVGRAMVLGPNTPTPIPLQSFQDPLDLPTQKRCPSRSRPHTAPQSFLIQYHFHIAISRT